MVLIKPATYLRETYWTKIRWQKKTYSLDFENLSPVNSAFLKIVVKYM